MFQQNILLQNIGIAGEIGVDVAGKSIGCFPNHEFIRNGKSTVAEISDDNTAHLTIHLSDIVFVKGEIQHQMFSSSQLVK